MNCLQLLLIGTLLVSLNCYSIDVTGADCPCSQFTAQLDCNSASACEWKDSSCQDIDCTTRSTITQCNVGTTICAYSNTNSKCEVFTSCTNYKYADGAACLTIGCQADVIGSDNLYPCKAITSLKKCSELTSTQTDCEDHNCYWNGTTCIAPTCAQQTSATQCTAIRSDTATNWQICSWTAATQTCADATGLTQVNCAVLSRGSYYWNTDNSACETCAGITSNYQNLVSIAFMILFLIY